MAAVACKGPNASAHGRAATASERAAPLALPDSQASAAPAALAFCSSVGATLRTVVASNPAADTAHASRVSGPDTATFHYQWARRDAPGCRVTAAGTDSAARDGTLRSIDAALEGAAWKSADSLYEADGPDGSMRGFIKGDTICLREDAWDGENDDDSTYVPRPDFTVTLTCAPRRPDDRPPS